MMQALLRGLILTCKHFFRKSITIRYPEEKRLIPERFRGRPILLSQENGKPVCIACGLCARICPSLCITVKPETGPDGVRQPADYTLDLNRCTFCGLCVEFCPVSANRMSATYELASVSRKDLYLGLADLLTGVPVSEPVK